jgi:hypothetical protein
VKQADTEILGLAMESVLDLNSEAETSSTFLLPDVDDQTVNIFVHRRSICAKSGNSRAAMSGRGEGGPTQVETV